MSRLLKTIFLTAIILGGIWALINRDRLKEPGVLLGQLKQKVGGIAASVASSILPSFSTVETNGAAEKVIRLASFKLEQFGSRADEIKRLPILADICRRYDLIALQGFDGRDDRWLETLADAIQSLRQDADYAFITDADPLNPSPTQNVILFDRRTIELDSSHWYRVQDPQQVLRRAPLVGWFRTRIEPADRAFTFTVANVEFDGLSPALEADYLTSLFKAIRNDGREEDDVILMGAFGGCDEKFAVAQQRSGIVWVLSNFPTDVRQTTPLDNILFQRQATVEFTGRCGVLDFMRLYNLRLAEAESLSSRLPVWAEFSAYEGSTISAPATRTAKADETEPF
jgi:hypothetical protein